MLYHLLFPMNKMFYVLKYSTFRAIWAAVTAMAITFLIGKFVIGFLKKMKAGQPIRSDGPSSHHVKSGTPTMGGIMIIIAVLVSTLLWARLDNNFIWLTLFVFTWYAGLGGVDDYLKLSRKNPKGVSIKVKLAGQFIGAAIVVLYLVNNPVLSDYDTYIKVPLIKYPTDLGLLYFGFVMLVIVSFSNAVNFTDGLDGLATGSLIFSVLSVAVVAYVVGNAKFSDYLHILHVSEASELVIFCAAVVGACLGFLWFNCHPAQVFMGDIGSLALGASIGMIAVLVKQEILMVLIGGIFVVEALSVLLQIISFRFFGKRILKMAPLHHHFELMGMHETKIVVRFWIVTIIIALVSLSFLKLR